MSTKEQIETSKKPTNKKLSALEKELLEYAKKGQPVLLYGKDTHGREDLIKRIHLRNEGIDYWYEYTGRDKNINSINDLQKAIIEVYMEKDRKKEEEFLLHCKDTIKTCLVVDCDVESGEKTFERLSCFEYKFMLYNIEILFKLIQGVNADSILLYGKVKDPFLSKSYFMSDTKELIRRKGMLFINNLRCKEDNSEDEEWYTKLAKKIESRKIRDCDSGGWLVAYAYDYTTFPEYFKKQFELVSLDGEGAGHTLVLKSLMYNTHMLSVLSSLRLVL